MSGGKHFLGSRIIYTSWQAVHHWHAKNKCLLEEQKLDKWTNEQTLETFNYNRELIIYILHVFKTAKPRVVSLAYVSAGRTRRSAGAVFVCYN